MHQLLANKRLKLRKTFSLIFDLRIKTPADYVELVQTWSKGFPS